MTSNCTQGLQKDARIINPKYSYSVMDGHTWMVEVKVQDNPTNLWGDTLRLEIFDIDTDQPLASANEQDYEVGETKTIMFYGIMPSKDLHVRLSLVDVQPLIYDDCEDSVSFTIKLAKTEAEEQEELSSPSNLLLYFSILILIIVIFVSIKIALRR